MHMVVACVSCVSFVVGSERLIWFSQLCRQAGSSPEA